MPSEIDPEKTGARVYPWVFALIAGAVATWQVYHFQFSSGFDLFPGPRGDTRLTAYLVEHWYQALMGHASLMSPAMFYPVKGVLGFSDLYAAYIPGYAFLRSLGYDSLVALAVMVVFFCYLNFLACLVLLRNVLKCEMLPACAGALFFAFNNPKLAQPDHLQLQPVFLLPIAVGLILYFFINRKIVTEKRAFVVLALAGIALNLQLLTSYYIGWFFIFGSVLFILVSWLFRPTRMFIVETLKLRYRAVVGALLVFLLGLVPFVLVYWPALRSTGWYSLLPEYIPEVKSFLLMGEGNYVWAGATSFILAHGSGPDWGRRIGIGLIPSLAWVVASIFSIWLITETVVNSRWSRAAKNMSGREIGYYFLALMVLATNVFFMIGLQFRGHTLWKIVYILVPGAGAIRAVARYVIVLALPMGVAFAFMVQYGLQKVASRESILTRVSLAGALVLVSIAGLFEQLNSSEGMYYSIRAENAHIDKLAARLPDHCSAFYVTAESNGNPEDFGEQNSMHDAMLVSIKRHVPTLNGRSGKYPPDWSLRNIKATDYDDKVQRWIREHGIPGTVCRLQVD